MVTQADFHRHFELAGHHGFMEDVKVQVIDRILGESRVREGFWQFKLDSFAPNGTQCQTCGRGGSKGATGAQAPVKVARKSLKASFL